MPFPSNNENSITTQHLNLTDYKRALKYYNSTQTDSPDDFWDLFNANVVPEIKQAFSGEADSTILADLSNPGIGYYKKVEPNYSKSLEQVLYDEGLLKLSSEDSSQLKENGFLTLYTLVRNLVETELGKTIEDVLRHAIGDSYADFIAGTGAGFVVVGGRTITSTHFQAFVNKYPHVYETGQQRLDAIELLSAAPFTTITEQSSDMPLYGDQEYIFWEPAQLEGATHFVSFGYLFDGKVGTLEGIDQMPKTSMADGPDKVALIRSSYPKTERVSLLDFTSPGDHFGDYEMLSFSDSGLTGLLSHVMKNHNKIFKNAPIAKRVAPGTQVKVISEGHGPGAFYSQIEVIGPEESMVSPIPKSGLFIDSRVLRSWSVYTQATSGMSNDLPKHDLSYREQLAKVPVPTPSDSNIGKVEWLDRDECSPWLDEATNRYYLTVQVDSEEKPSLKERQTALKKGVEALLRYYNKKRSPKFVSKLLALNHGLFASIEASSPPQRGASDNAYKYKIGIPRTYFEHPDLEAKVTSTHVQQLIKDKDNKKYKVKWHVEVSDLDKCFSQTKQILQHEFTKRIRAAKRENLYLEPPLDPSTEAQNVQQFANELRGILQLNIPGITQDDPGTLIFWMNESYQIKKLFFMKLRESANTKETQESTVDLLVMEKGLSCFVTNYGFPRTMAYLVHFSDGILHNEGEQLDNIQSISSGAAGLTLVKHFTLSSPKLEITSNAPPVKKTQDDITRPPEADDKSIKTKQQKTKEDALVSDLKKNMEVYNARKNTSTSTLDTVFTDLQDALGGLTSADEWYTRILNRIDIKEIIAAGYTCAAKLLPVSDVLAMAQKNILKTIGYENLKHILGILGPYADEQCPDIMQNYIQVINANKEATSDDDSTSSSIPENASFSFVIEHMSREIEDDYLCYSGGQIVSALGHRYTHRSRTSLTLGDIGETLSAEQAADQRYADALHVREKVKSDFEKRREERLQKDINAKLLKKLDYEGVLGCILNVLQQHRDELEEKINALFGSLGLDRSLVKKLLHPEDFLNENVFKQIRVGDPAGSYHRIESNTPTFDIPEMPGGHDDPMAMMDRELDKAYALLGDGLSAIIKDVLEQLLRLCSSGGDALQSLMGDSTDSSSGLQEAIQGFRRSPYSLPSTTLDFSPSQLQKIKNYDLLSPPAASSNILANYPGQLYIAELLDRTNDFQTAVIFHNIIKRMGGLPTDQIITETHSLLDIISKLLKPSEVCLVMMGTAHNVIYKLIYKTVTTSGTLSSAETTTPGPSFVNLRTLFSNTTDVKEFFALMGSYIDISFCSAVVSSINTVARACERELEDDWYCGELQQRGYSEKECKKILTDDLERDKRRLEHLGDLLASSNIADLADLPSLFQDPGVIGGPPKMPPYIQKILDSSIDKLLDAAANKFDMELRGVKPLFMDEISIPEGDIDFPRMPEEGRDYIGRWSDICPQLQQLAEDEEVYSSVGGTTTVKELGESEWKNLGDCNFAPKSHAAGMEIYNNTWEGKGYNLLDKNTWPRMDKTVRKVAESLRLNLALDNSNILKYGPVNVYPTHFDGTVVDDNTLSNIAYNTELASSNVPAKMHYTIINYHKILDSMFAQYVTKTFTATREITHQLYNDANDLESVLPFFESSYTGPIPLEDVSAGVTTIGFDVPDWFKNASMQLDSTTNSITFGYDYDVVLPIIPVATADILKKQKQLFRRPTDKLVEIAYPKYIQLRSKTFAATYGTSKISEEAVNLFKDYPLDTMSLRIYDRAGKFSKLNTDFAQTPGATGVPPSKPNIIIEFAGVMGADSGAIEGAIETLKENIYKYNPDELTLDIEDAGVAQLLSYQQWLFSALFTDSVQDFLPLPFDEIGTSTTSQGWMTTKPRRNSFMESCMKIYDLVFASGVTNILAQIVQSPLFNTDVFDRLRLLGRSSIYDLETLNCTPKPPHDAVFGMGTPPPISDLLNTESLRKLAKLTIQEDSCQEGSLGRALERLAALAYIRVVLLENLLRGLMLFTVVSPSDLLKDNKMFIKYIIEMIKRSARKHNDLYYQKILDICFDMTVSDIGCTYGGVPIKVIDKTISFEDATPEQALNDAEEKKKYNLEWLLHHPLGQKRLPEVKEACLMLIVQQQIEDIDEPISQILTVPGTEYKKLEFLSAILVNQRLDDGTLLKDSSYFDMPLNLIDFDLYQGKRAFEDDVLEKDSTYLPHYLYGVRPLETSLKDEWEFIGGDLGGLKTADINIDGNSALFWLYETEGLDLVSQTSFFIGKKGTEQYLNVGAFNSVLRNQNRSTFYQEPPVMDAEWVEDTIIETFPEYVMIDQAQVAEIMKDILLHSEPDDTPPTLESLGIYSKAYSFDNTGINWSGIVFGLASMLAPGLMAPLFSIGGIGFAAGPSSIADDALGIAIGSAIPEAYTIEGIFNALDAPTEYWAPKSLVISKFGLGAALEVAADADAFIEQNLGSQDDLMFTSKMTPLGNATKNGGFAIQRYLRLSLKSGLRSTQYKEDDLNSLLLPLAFNFGYDGGIEYSSFSFPGGDPEPGAGPQAFDLLSPQAGIVNQMVMSSVMVSKNYFDLWADQGSAGSLFSTKALDCAILNSFLFNLVAEDFHTQANITGWGGNYNDIPKGNYLDYDWESPTLDQFTHKPGPGLDKFLEELMNQSIPFGGTPQLGHKYVDIVQELAAQPLAYWFSDIKIGQRLVYVFPHNMDITKQSLDSLPPGVAELIEAEGLVKVMSDKDKDLLVSTTMLGTDTTDDAVILNTTQEGPDYNGSFADMVASLVTSEITTNSDELGDSFVEKHTIGEEFSDKMFSKRFLRQQEMVVKPNETSVGLKRIYSLPVKDCFAEYDLDLASTPYAAFIEHYYRKQRAMEKAYKKFNEDMAIAYVLGDQPTLQNLCADFLGEDELQLLHDWSLDSNLAIMAQTDLHRTYGAVVQPAEKVGDLLWSFHPNWNDASSQPHDPFLPDDYGGEYDLNKDGISDITNPTKLQATAYDALSGFLNDDEAYNPGEQPPPLSDDMIIDWLSEDYQTDDPEEMETINYWIADWKENGFEHADSGGRLEYLFNKNAAPYEMDSVNAGAAQEYLSFWGEWNKKTKLHQLNVFKQMKTCAKKFRFKYIHETNGFIDDYCSNKIVSMPFGGSSVPNATGNIHEALTAQLFNKPNAKMLAKYILSEEVIKSMATIHTIFYPVDFSIDVENMFTYTKDILHSINSAASSPSDEYFDEGPSAHTDRGGSRGSHTAGMDRASTSRSESAIVSYFQKLATKLIFKSIVGQADPAWKRAFKIQEMTGINDKDMPWLVLGLRPLPYFLPPIGDPSIVLSPYGMIYMGMSFLEPLSENFNSLHPPEPSYDLGICSD